MTYVDTASRGATRQSWARDSIRAVFREIQVEHPKAGHGRLARLLADRMQEDPDALNAAADYIVKICLEALEGYERRQPRPPVDPVQREQRQADIVAAAAKIKEQILLLNLEMPNGKRMRYCTGTEMLSWGRGYAKIGKRVGNKIVGQVLNEDEARSLLGR